MCDRIVIVEGKGTKKQAGYRSKAVTVHESPHDGKLRLGWGSGRGKGGWGGSHKEKDDHDYLKRNTPHLVLIRSNAVVRRHACYCKTHEEDEVEENLTAHQAGEGPSICRRMSAGG